MSIGEESPMEIYVWLVGWVKILRELGVGIWELGFGSWELTFVGWLAFGSWFGSWELDFGGCSDTSNVQ